MRILFQMPSLDTVYAGRTIYHGYKNAFIDLGHQFETMTANDEMEKKIDEFAPDIFFTCLSSYYLKFLKLDAIKRHRKRGMKVFVNMPYWRSPISKFRINEDLGLSKNEPYINLIRSGDFGDVYYNTCEQDDRRMDGFSETVSHQFHTMPLAADKIALHPVFQERFQGDISFVGTYLPTKKDFFKTNVFPLAKKYHLRIYGQDWTMNDRMLGWVQRGGQYFNLPYLRSIRKPKLSLADEAKIYRSSTVSINVHEAYQKEFGGECNERTFKIPFCGGFEITDQVACIKKYFIEGKEMIIANDANDWIEKIDFYLRHPEDRMAVIAAGRERVLNEHTYHHRIRKMLDIYESLPT